MHMDFCLRCMKKDTTSPSTLTSLLPGHAVVLLKIQMDKAGVRPEENFSEALFYRACG